MLRVYIYDKCGSCQKAVRFLQASGAAFETVPIRERPPTLKELRLMLQAAGSIRKLFNTSGKDYRDLSLGSKLPMLNDDEALLLLNANGNLVKRPFGLDLEAGVFLLGFDLEKWRQTLN